MSKRFAAAAIVAGLLLGGSALADNAKCCAGGGFEIDVLGLDASRGNLEDETPDGTPFVSQTWSKEEGGRIWNAAVVTFRQPLKAELAALLVSMAAKIDGWTLIRHSAVVIAGRSGYEIVVDKVIEPGIKPLRHRLRAVLGNDGKLYAMSFSGPPDDTADAFFDSFHLVD